MSSPPSQSTTNVPVNLPDVVLATIFAVVCAHQPVLLPFRPGNQRLLIQLVCRAWDKIIRNTGTLWSDILFTAPQRSPYIPPTALLAQFALCAARSDTERLCIAFDMGRNDWPFSIVQEIVVPCVKRIERLICPLISNEEIIAFMTINKKFKALKSIDILLVDTWDNNSSSFTPGTCVNFNALRTAPQLHKVTMRLYNGLHPLNDVHLRWARLTALDLGTMPMPPEIAVRILRQCRRRLQDAYFYIRFGKAHNTLGRYGIHMRTLRKLRLRVMYPTNDTRLWSILEVPALESLWIEMFDGAYYQCWAPLIYEHLLRTCTDSLQELYLSDFLPREFGLIDQRRRFYETTNSILEEIFELVPNIHSLRLPLGLPVHTVTMEKIASGALLPCLRALEFGTTMDSAWGALSMLESRREYALRASFEPGSSSSHLKIPVNTRKLQLETISFLCVYVPRGEYSQQECEALEKKQRALTSAGITILIRPVINLPLPMMR